MMGLLTEEYEDITISDMVKKDQEMRQKDNFDVDVDFANQSQLKKIIGDDPQKLLDSIDNIKDVEGIWLIAQHADNDNELQKMILNLLESNVQMLSKKFNVPETYIKYGIAMLTDRIMVNSTTSVEGYRENSKDDFSDISKGIQKYGTQGGFNEFGWVPRPIKMNGKVYFFSTPKELYENKEFLNQINKIRNEVGLPNLEDYVQKMQKNI